MAQSFAMFCIGTWISEYLRNRLNRRTLTVIGIFTGVCILQYSAIEIYALMGCGTGTGSTRIEDAVKSALESPLLNDFDLSTAKNVLVNITTGENPDGLTMSQYGEVIKMIENRTGMADNFKSGLVFDENPEFGDRLNVTYESNHSLYTMGVTKQEGKEQYIESRNHKDRASNDWGTGEDMLDPSDKLSESHNCEDETSNIEDKLLNESKIDRYRDLSELWDEDELMVETINEVILSTRIWGSMSAGLIEHLKSTLKAKINWRLVLLGFRASIITSRRQLTRMKPNRRTGFQNMGSTRKFDSRILVAVDVSGSISTYELRRFYGVINSAFRYGFESVDVIQFDCGIKVVQQLKKVVRSTCVVGRGGTSFQEPIEYAHEHSYDGLVMLTDGFAPPPTVPKNFRPRILWVCPNIECYRSNEEWMRCYGRVCVMQLI
ncbi:MAG: hypothetical protein E7117_05185 [Bacteroidales bacterium]|nr:hypothetical protein [Bacteroidales bacterium]